MKEYFLCLIVAFFAVPVFADPPHYSECDVDVQCSAGEECVELESGPVCTICCTSNSECLEARGPDHKCKFNICLPNDEDIDDDEDLEVLCLSVVDAGVVVDSGVGGADGGTVVDSGGSVSDGGQAIDSGEPSCDAGGAVLDAGAVSSDAGAITDEDGGVVSSGDSGNPTAVPGDISGSGISVATGCSSNHSSEDKSLALVGLLAIFGLLPFRKKGR